MTTLTIPNAITADDDIEAAPLAENFAAIASQVNTELVNRDGTIAMTAELQLVDGNNADCASNGASRSYRRRRIPGSESPLGAWRQAR